MIKLAYIPDYPCRILIIGASGSRKTNVLLNLIKHPWPDIDKILLYIKKLFESKHQLLVNGKEEVWIKTLKTSKVFIDYSKAIYDIYENLEHYNPTEKRRVLIVFDDMIADMESNKKLSPIVYKLFLRGSLKTQKFHLFLHHNLISKSLKL